MARQPANAGALPFVAVPSVQPVPVVPLPPSALTATLLAVSLTGMLLVGYVGTVAAAGFLAGWVLLGVGYGQAAMLLLLRGPVLVWLLPGFGLLSVLWSQAPGDSLRFALEFIATIGCAVLSARLLKPRTLLVSLTVALIAISAVSLLLGRYVGDDLTGGRAFVGVFESKNQLGFFSSVMLLVATALVIDRDQPGLLRLLGSATVLLSLPLLALSRSATSLGSVAIGLAALLLGLPLSRLDRFGRARMLFVGGVVLVLTLLALFAAGADGEGLALRLLNRDATFTGRTILWRYAALIIPDHALLGYGFNAFWLRDRPDPEALWAAFHLTGRRGFTFHNTWVEAVVELGYLGAALTAVVVLGILIGAIRWSWQTRTVPAAFFVAVVLCLVARSFTEVDILSAFDIGTFILTVAGTYAALKPREVTA